MSFGGHPWVGEDTETGGALEPRNTDRDDFSFDSRVPPWKSDPGESHLTAWERDRRRRVWSGHSLAAGVLDSEVSENFVVDPVHQAPFHVDDHQWEQPLRCTP